jgi:hypothetical protein
MSEFSINKRLLIDLMENRKDLQTILLDMRENYLITEDDIQRTVKIINDLGKLTDDLIRKMPI